MQHYVLCIFHSVFAETHQGKSVDLHIKNLHLPVSYITVLALMFLIGFQVGAEPLQLKRPVWVVAIIHLINAWNQKKKKKHSLKTHIKFKCLKRQHPGFFFFEGGWGGTYQQTH